VSASLFTGIRFPPFLDRDRSDRRIENSKHLSGAIGRRARIYRVRVFTNFTAVCGTIDNKTVYTYLSHCDSRKLGNFAILLFTCRSFTLRRFSTFCFSFFSRYSVRFLGKRELSTARCFAVYFILYLLRPKNND